MRPGASNVELAAIKQSPLVSRRLKRSRWVYLGAVLGAAIVVVLGIVVGIAMYWHSLIQNYTAAQPQPLPVVQVSDADFTALSTRWAAFQEAVANGTAAESFRASAAELNLFIARNPSLQDRVRMIITNNQVHGHFIVPLDQAKQRKL